MHEVTMLITVTLVIIKLNMEIKGHKAGKDGTKNSTSYTGGGRGDHREADVPQLYTQAETECLLYVVGLPWHICCT